MFDLKWHSMDEVLYSIDYGWNMTFTQSTILLYIWSIPFCIHMLHTIKNILILPQVS